jgi:hypothetical protein
MAERKYAHLVKLLSVGRVEEHGGPGDANQKVRLGGSEHLEGMNLSFTWELHNQVGEWRTGLDPHVHPYPECNVFAGLDTANVKYLGAEIEYRLGEEQESYTFDEPTAVIIPAGLPHGPTITRRIQSPKGFAFYQAALTSSRETTWLRRSVEPVKATGKYANLIKPLKSGLLTERGIFNASRFTPEQLAQREERVKKTGEKLGPANADHLVWMYGRDLEGLKVNLTWGFYTRTGIWHRGVGAHVHPVGEILVFVGTDPNNIDYLGAEIEIDLGKQHERYIFDKPSVVICPAGLPHNPVITRWVDKPYSFIVINLNGEHETHSVD